MVDSFIEFNATYNNISVKYRGGKFCWRRKPEKTTDLSKVRQTLSHNVVSSTTRHERGSKYRIELLKYICISIL